MPLWRHSNEVQQYHGAIAPSAEASLYAAETDDPILVYSDADLTTPLTWPVVADIYGRFPAVYFDFQSIRARVETSTGLLIFDVDNDDYPEPPTVPASADPTKQAETGDIWHSFKTGLKDGWVRANGRTIGSALSAATERAHDDTEDLFTLLYGNLSDALAQVSGGRGVSAALDFSANKTITLSSALGRVLAGVDEMGNTASSRFASVPVVAGAVNTIGSVLGENRHALVTGELATHSHLLTDAGHSHTINITDPGHIHSVPITDPGHSHTVNITDPGHTHSQSYATTSFAAGGFLAITAPTGGAVPWSTGSNTTGITAASVSNTTGITASASSHATGITAASVSQTTGITVNNEGSGTAHNTVQQSLLVTVYIKL